MWNLVTAQCPLPSLSDPCFDVCDLEKMENNKQKVYLKYLVFVRLFTQASLP